MKIRFRFNMIEVVLAIAILAIGLSSVMVLFTSGLRAQSGAAEEILLSQLANEITDSLRAGRQASASISGWAADNITGVEDSDYAHFAQPSATTPSTWIYPAAGTSKANRVYLRRVPSTFKSDGSPDEYVNDLAVMVFIKEVPQTMIVADKTVSADTFVSAEKGNAKYPGKFSKTYLVKMSWPADIPLDVRKEKGNIRYFRVNVFNENFDVTDQSL